jgi:hypothetical protein
MDEIIFLRLMEWFLKGQVLELRTLLSALYALFEALHNCELLLDSLRSHELRRSCWPPNVTCNMEDSQGGRGQRQALLSPAMNLWMWDPVGAHARMDAALNP